MAPKPASIVLTAHEVKTLADYCAAQPSRWRTYALVNEKGVNYVRNADGSLYRLTARMDERERR